MRGQNYASLSEIDDAYATPDEYESREDRRRRKANRRSAVKRWRDLHSSTVPTDTVQAQRSRRAQLTANRRQRLTAIERNAERAQNMLRTAARRQQMTPEETRMRRDLDARRHARARSHANGTALCALSTIDDYQGHIERHNIGSMTQVCPHCRALKWTGETRSMCCLNGQVTLAPLGEPSTELKDLMTRPSFVRQLRAYNNIFAFTSMGASVDANFANGRQGVYTFRVQGTICHRIGSLLPPEGHSPQFAQIYVYDSDMDHQVGTRMDIIEGLDEDTVRKLQTMLMRENPLAQRFLTAGEYARNGQDFCLAIHEDPGTDLRRYNRPTSNEVAAIIIDQNVSNERDIILHPREGGLRRISDLHPAYDPLQFPLLLPRGEYGWSPRVEYVSGVTRYGNARVKIRDFYAYQLFTRVDEYSLLHLSSRLFQQWCVEQYVKIELQRLRFITQHQATLRADLYRGVIDATLHDANLGEIGRFVLLPITFTGGDRYMKKQYYDAMAIVREVGKPDIFLTVTCNGDWPEIKEALLPGQTAIDRPDIVARVFRLKLAAIKDDIIKNEIFGKVRALIYVIEFQKRGLPHAHMLIKLAEEASPRRPEDYDKIVCAEIPDPNEHRQLYETVTKCMMHGPCGALDRNAPCMRDGVCTKEFPKTFHENTTSTESGYPEYRRRDQGRSTVRKHVELDNRWVVPYNPYLCEKYNCHINVEICSTINAIKYVYKYVYKGQDRANVTLDAVEDDVGNGTTHRIDVDEVQDFLSGRYICPPESCWRIFKFPMQWKSHTVMQLPVHLPDMNYIVFDPERPAEIPSMRHTELTRFFEMCAADEDARELLYYEFPRRYTWKNKHWHLRTTADGNEAIGRMVAVSPNDPERFYLRVLLCNVKGPTSFEALRTVDGTVYDTFQEAAQARGLLEDDGEWHRCMEEASSYQMPSQLRNLFAILLVHCHPANARALWDEYLDAMSEDFQRELNKPPTDREVIYRTVQALDNCLQSNNKTIDDFPGLPSLSDFNDLHRDDPTSNRLLDTEKAYDRRMLAELHDQVERLNRHQLAVYNKVIDAVHYISSEDNTASADKLFFLDGPGGTGKSFLLQTILATVRLEGNIALAVASSGIASTQLMGGRTAHYTFQLGLDLTATSTCNITANSSRAELLRRTSLIVWDEAPLMIKYGFEAVNRTLQDLMQNDKPFGGKVVLLAGDFRQILPVIPRGSPGQIVDSCIKHSLLWNHFKVLHLGINMRVQSMTDEATAAETQAFADFLLRVGEGRNDGCTEYGEDYTRIQHDMVLSASDGITQDQAIIDHVYGDMARRYLDQDYFAIRAILTPLNDDVNKLNNAAIEALPG